MSARMGPRRLELALLIGGMGMLGPFAIDTLFPAFPAVATALKVDAAWVQQTLSTYLFGFALMSLLHGPLSDRYGRKPILLVALLVFAGASLACAFAQSIETLLWARWVQGLSAGAGTVIGRAVVRDVVEGPEAQRLMSQVTLVFAIAPAIAPVIGGWLFEAYGWRSIFWFITAFGLLVFAACAWRLPETLPQEQRQPLSASSMFRDYGRMCMDPVARALVMAAALNFAALFLMIASAPSIVLDIMGLKTTQFHYFFLPMIGSILLGSQLSGRLAGRIPNRKQVAIAYQIMLACAVLHLCVQCLPIAHVYPWAILFACMYGVGSAMAFPVLTLKLLDRFPHQRGAAASMQAFSSLMVNALAAGLLSPLLHQSLWQIGLGQLGMMAIGYWFWRSYLRAAPDPAPLPQAEARA